MFWDCAAKAFDEIAAGTRELIAAALA